MAENERHGEESGNSIPTPIPAEVSPDGLSSLASTASADSYRPIHSLLLCPAQWSALLESPISLVRGRGEGEVGHPQDGGETLKGGTVEERLAVASSEVGGERSLQPHSCLDDKSTAINITAVPRDLQPLAEPTGSTSNWNNSSQEELVTSDITADEVKCQDHQSSRSSAHIQSPLPCQLSGSSQGSSITTCTSPLQQLDEEEEGDSGNTDKKAKSQTLVVGSIGGSSRLSLRQPPHSAPNTPLSESKQLPPTHSVLPSFPSHARNISETPSLPPFISSSTSSAYHSRNSSLTSQITSECFDSDNQSQFTDIDSCIVLHGGAQGEIHRPVSLQDSRFKFPEGGISLDQIQASQMQCFSVSDFNLNQQFSFLPSPNLEETLQSSASRAGAEAGGGVCGPSDTPNETIQEKLQASGIKSSEWIKREMTRASQSLIHVKISSKTKHVVHYNVRAGDMIIWEFATKKKDIGFGVMFENTEVVIQESTTEEEEDDDVSEKSPEDKVIPILPHLRVNAHTRPCIGSHTATQDGVYEIVFENTYSRFFAKELFYRITTQPSQPNDNQNYLKQ